MSIPLSSGSHSFHLLMIPERLEKVKTWCADNKKDLFTAAFIFLVGLGSFGLGRLSVIWTEKEPITIDQIGEIDQSSGSAGLDKNGGAFIKPSDLSASSILSVKGKYVASKSGAYYHFPWCAGALRIKDANKIWFQTKQEAESRGLKPASNCPGL